VFSGLDPTTEDIVFHNLLGQEGLLRNANMTVVLASSDGIVHHPFDTDLFY
jgi:ATP-binding cassette, subfamily C (CFTR/MRP), member 1